MPATTTAPPLTARRDGAIAVQLPGGWLDPAGACHADAELRPLRGWEEEALAAADPAAPAAALATALLARCVTRLGPHRPVTPTLARDLLVGDRDFLVLRLRELTLGPSMRLTLACPREACGRPMDVTLQLADLPVDRRPVARRTHVSACGAPFRLPTGADQEAVAALARTDVSAAADALLRRCLEPAGREAEALAPADAARIDAEMAALAPGVNVELEGRCPECGEPFDLPLDLVPLALAELGGSRQRLDRDVHLLAWNYHWSEREILSLPLARRRRYVALVEQELDAELG